MKQQTRAGIYSGADSPVPQIFAPTLHGEYGGGVQSRDRHHGDPFPLPSFVSNSMGDGDNDASFSLRKRLMNEAVKSVNGLASASLNARKALRHDHSPSPELKPTEVQRVMLDDMVRRIDRFVAEPSTMSEDEALKDLLGASHLYEQEASHLVPFDVNRIKIFSRRLKPMDAIGLCPPHVKCFLQYHAQMIEKTSEEISSDNVDGPQISPYWDPVLRNSRQARIQLYQALDRSGLLCFRRRRKSVISFFTVKKKDGWQRLILDCRATNMCHRKPPSTRLSTPSCFSGIDMTDETFASCGYGGVLGQSDFQAAGNEGDAGDCFYNFAIPSLASWFATKDDFLVEELIDLGLLPDSIYDDDLGRFEKPLPGERLIPCFQGVPMGWSWALHIANEIVSYQVSLACEKGDLCELRDKLPPPPLQRGRVLAGTYVDNVQILGGDGADVDKHLQLIVDWFEKLGIPFTTAGQTALSEFETLGIVFDMRQRCIRHRNKRAWRLYLATKALLRRGRVHGETMRIWLGHVVNHFQLMRPAMSCLHASYRFVQHALSSRAMMWPSVRFELRLVAGLVFLGQLDWASPYHTEVYLGDSSTYGYSLMSTIATSSEVREAMRYEERWRFIEAETVDKEVGIGGISCPVVGYTPGASLGVQTRFGQIMQQQSEDFHMVRRYKRVKTSTLKDDKKRVMVEIPSACKPLPKQWFRQDRYRLIVARRWKYRSEHINLKEGRVSLMGLRRHARSKNSLGTRLLTISDNMSSLLAFSKGRSKSFALNQLVRRAAAYSVGLRIQWCLRHVKSEDNASDESSRWHDPAVMQAWLQRRTQSTTPPKQKRYAAEVPLGGGQPMKVVEKDQPGADNDEVKRVGRIRSLVSYLPLFFLELFAGSGRLTSSVSGLGMNVLDPFEIFDGWEFDLCRPQTQALLIELIRMGLVWYIHAGVPCTVWSRARHNISNHVKARAKEKVAIELTMFCVALFRAQSRVGWYWSMENPASSRIFEFRPIVELHALPHVQLVVFHMCQYGQPFKKPTAILTNLSSLLALARKCQGGHKHVQLVGREQYKTNDGRVSWRNKTAAAGEYPPSLTRVWANILEKEAPDAARFPDVSKFRESFRKRLQEIAGGCGQKREGPQNFSDLQPSDFPLKRANKYPFPVVFGQRTAKEAAWLRKQGA